MPQPPQEAPRSLAQQLSMSFTNLTRGGFNGRFDPIPANEITEIAETDITNMSDPSNPLTDQ